MIHKTKIKKILRKKIIIDVIKHRVQKNCFLETQPSGFLGFIGFFAGFLNFNVQCEKNLAKK